MKKTDVWRGYTRQELTRRREEAMQDIRLEINSLNVGIQNARRNGIVRTFDVVKQLARMAGYVELIALVFKVWKFLRKFRV